MRTRAAALGAIVFAACGMGTGSGDVSVVSRQVTVQVAGHGSIRLSTGQQCRDRCVVTVPNGARVSASAAADDDSTFAGWSGACSAADACEVVVDRDLEIDAAFSLRPTQAGQHVLTAAKNGAGTVRSSPGGIDCGGTCSSPFADGTAVSLSATADSGWRFDGWGGGCGGSGGCAVRIAADVTVWATFVKIPPAQHRLSVSLIGDGAGRVAFQPGGLDCGTSCSASFDEGTSVTLSARPAAGSTFAGWSGACSGTGDCTATLSADVWVVATFSIAVTPPPPDECAELRPRVAPPAQTRHTIKSLATCQAGVSDGSGTVALGMTNADPVSESVLHFVSPSGDLLASHTGTNAVVTGQLAGFEGYVWSSDAKSTLRRAWDSKGQILADTAAVPDGSVFIGEDPLGGFVIWRIAAPGGPLLVNYDEHLKVRWSVTTPAYGEPGAVAVDRAGRTLVLFGADPQTAPKSVDGMWVDHQGVAGAVFRALGPQQEPTHLMGFALTQRVGDGLFLKAGNDWIGQLDSLSTTVAAAPVWLKARPGTSLHMAHGGRGYAVLPPSTGGCVKAVEVMAPSGASCGSATFAAASDSCSAATPTVGYDGTLMLAFSEAADQCKPFGTCTCTWQWWPGFFR